MSQHRFRRAACLGFLLLCAGRHTPLSAATTAVSPAGLRLETSVTYTANLVHWVDNLAGTSVGKTMPAYRAAWIGRFGALSEADREALRAFAGLRRAEVPVDVRVENETGCLPVEADTMTWHQRFLAQAMQAGSVEDLAQALYPASPADRRTLISSLSRFEPRFRQVWSELEHVRAFEGRFHRFLEKGGLPAYLDALAAFFDVDARGAPMRISFIGLPVDGPTHAEADGDHLLVEIRPNDSPEDQIQVVAHEAAHFLMRRIPPARMDALIAEALAQGEAGALLWRLLWEGLPTALGQGLAEARLAPDSFSTSQRWYHIESVDRFAKMIYPGVAQAVAGRRTLDGPLMRSMASAIEASPLYSSASPRDFLMSSFLVVGSRLDLAGQALQHRLGPLSPPGFRLSLDDPRLEDLLRRYRCLPGVLLVVADELRRAAGLDGGLSLSSRALRQARDRAEKGEGAILAGRRPGGGPVFVLVAPGADQASHVLEKFIALKGIPSGVVSVPESRAQQR